MYSVAILGGLEVNKEWNQIILINSYQCHYLKHDMLLSTQSSVLPETQYITCK